MQDRDDGNPAVAALKVVGGASFTALSSIGEALDVSAQAVGNTSAEVVATAVSHCHGDDAGRVTEEGLRAVGDVALAARNASIFNKKKLGSTLAKSAAPA